MATTLLAEPLVWLGDLALNEADDFGVTWLATGVSGWSGSPSGTTEITQRTGDHGGWASPSYLQSRVLEVTGFVEAPNRPSLLTAIDRLTAAASLGETTLRVTEGGFDRQATVLRAGEVLVDVSTYSAAFSVPLTAPDPRRYAATQESGSVGLPISSGGLAPPLTPPLTVTATTVSGEITATNAGNFETRPVFTIDGPVASPQIITQMPDNSVTFLNYSQDLAAGEQLVIDTDAHTAILNGNVSRRRFLAAPNGWPTMPAASSVTFLFRSVGYSSAASLTATWRSAWL